MSAIFMYQEAEQVALDKPELAGSELITVEQLPVITERLAQLSGEIDLRVKDVLALACTESTVKTVKQERAALTKVFNSLEARRKQVKSDVLAPYERFETVYKNLVSSKFNAADAKLKEKIDSVEDALKQKKREDLSAYFDECCAALDVDFVTMERWNPNVTKTASLKSLKEEAHAFLSHIADGLTAIETMEHSAEILVEYRRSLNLPESIATVSARRKAIEEQKKRQAEQEARRIAEVESVQKVEKAISETAPEPLSAPTAVTPEVQSDPVKTLRFTVTAPVSKLKVLKAFLIEGGYLIE